MNQDLRAYLSLSPVVPVLTIHRVEDAEPLARALLAGGLKVLEVTLRTAAALEAMHCIAAEVPEAILAAGTVLSAKDLKRSAKAGARFAFSPGLADFMLEEGPIPILPGVATASEVMRAAEAGLSTFKFFPAVPAGGVGALKALHGPFADVAFCPTGGIDAGNAADFLALSNVLCVGGSWVAPAKAVEAGDWAAIEALARAAAALKKS
ncbi:MAG: 4-hydroxy-2-oxoglutarate aldolase/2-deydro-3-deoxyphosphogluconate aldolase [Caulobacteraceae bacterium]|nr:4-hydroxy-2-oxoglutarate aldolase/2-deydro-3-deoxyphosphogluconate aldolase [Caulobacteraceae bacterium]